MDLVGGEGARTAIFLSLSREDQMDEANCE